MLTIVNLTVASIKFFTPKPSISNDIFQSILPNRFLVLSFSFICILSVFSKNPNSKRHACLIETSFTACLIVSKRQIPVLERCNACWKPPPLLSPLKHLIMHMNVHSDVTTQWLLLITVSLSEVMHTNYVHQPRRDSVGNTLHYFGATSQFAAYLLYFSTTLVTTALFTTRRNVDLLTRVVVMTD